MTTLPPASNATNAAATEGDVKTFLTALRDYLNGLFGSTGVPADARNALGVSNNTVAKTGDTMTGPLSVPELTVTSDGPLIKMIDTDSMTRYLHHQGGVMGFLDNTGNWAFYEDNNGALWSKAYGVLHNFFSTRSYVDSTFAPRTAYVDVTALATVGGAAQSQQIRLTRANGSNSTVYTYRAIGGGDSGGG
jgi:hypothetical protein